MKIVFLSVGKKHEKHMQDAIEDYTKRVHKYAKTEWKIIPTSTTGKETKDILKFIEYGDYVIALDERGKTLSTKDLAQFLEKRMIAGDRRLVFIIGGAYGLDDAIRERANLLWSLSALTFPHQLVRIILAEAVYRAFSALNKEPYHHA